MIGGKSKELTRLEAKLRFQFQSEQQFTIGDGARASVVDYIRRFPPSVSEDQLADRLEQQLQLTFEKFEIPEATVDARHAVMSGVRAIAAQRREAGEVPGRTTLAEALYTLAKLSAPFAVCLAVYVWRTGIIPEYPIGALYEINNNSAGDTAR